jgi:excisionase family DNA binding protein
MTTKTSSGLEAQPSAQKQLTLLTLQEAAIYARVSVSTIRRWVCDEGLRVYKAGRQIRIDEMDLVRFLWGAKDELDSRYI